jgi:signal transduction histidine kinase
MALQLTARQSRVARRIEQVSGIRPVTLLVAFGIVLSTAILIATGVAANHLRQQALRATEGELGRIAAVLTESSKRLLDVVDAQLGEIGDRLRDAGNGTSALRAAAETPEISALLRGKIARYPRIEAAAVIGADGTVVAQAGNWSGGALNGRELIAAFSAVPGRNTVLGKAIGDPRSGNFSIPLMHRIEDAHAAFVGLVVGLVPSADFSRFFGSVSLAPDAAIVLLGRDGTILARQSRASGVVSAADRADVETVSSDTSVTMVRHVTADDGQWRVEALRSVPGYPLAIIVSRSASRALAGWAQQGMWFGVFAFAGAIAIGVMVYMIAHQFETYATISSIRSEKIEVERARLMAEAELLKAERLSVLGQLTATVAHELRNPLSAIRNTLFTVKELALNGGLKLDRPIARMERSIERCDRIISDLLEYTRTRELKRNGVPFDRWVGDVVRDQTMPSGVSLETELAAGEAQAPIDADRMRRVVINLIENAAQALGENPPDREKRITVRTTTRNRELVLTIEDTGQGIAPEHLARIFEPLFSTKSFGTGLGLPTVKQIVNQHGGTISVESAVGQGTCMTVRLPMEAETANEVKVAA